MVAAIIRGVETGIDVASHGFRIAKSGSEIIDLTGVHSEVVTIALKTIQSFGSTVLCWISAKDLPINHVRTIVTYITQGATVTLISKLFCNIITSSKDFISWADKVGLMKKETVIAAIGSCQVLGKKVGVVFVAFLSEQVQDICGIASTVLDFAHQCQQVVLRGWNRKIAITMTQDVVKLLAKGISSLPQVKMWRIAINVCSLYTATTGLYKMWYEAYGITTRQQPQVLPQPQAPVAVAVVQANGAGNVPVQADRVAPLPAAPARQDAQVPAQDRVLLPQPVVAHAVQG